MRTHVFSVGEQDLAILAITDCFSLRPALFHGTQLIEAAAASTKQRVVSDHEHAREKQSAKSSSISPP
jgi:hypothetical protein